VKTLTVLFMFVCSASEVLLAQAYQDSWSFGIGFTYPRFLSTEVAPMNHNIGGFISLQRNFTANIALRFSGNYEYIEGNIPPGSYSYGNVVPESTAIMHSSIGSVNMDFFYYMVPCRDVDPYFGLGLGESYYRPIWSVSYPKIHSEFAFQLNAVAGTEWKVSDNWDINTELQIQSNKKPIDGIYVTQQHGFLGNGVEAYINYSVGLVYYFDKGDKCKSCDLYSGIQVESTKEKYPTLEQVDSLITAHIPKEVVKEVVVEKPVEKPVEKIVEKPVEKPVRHKMPATKKWVLTGVNFKSNSPELLQESYQVLKHAAQILKDYPDVRVEIQGYTDDVGSNKANMKLSQQRANKVKDYLVKEGVGKSRLTAAGYGSQFPVADNATELGKAENRRIEFKVIK